MPLLDSEEWLSAPLLRALQTIFERFDAGGDGTLNEAVRDPSHRKKPQRAHSRRVSPERLQCRYSHHRALRTLAAHAQVNAEDWKTFKWLLEEGCASRKRDAHA